MLQSIIVYTLTGLILYALGRNLALRDARMQRTFHHPASFWCTEIWLSILVFAIVAGLRYNVGVDHLVYLQFYEDMAKQGWITRETLELGFLFIMKVFTELNLHFFFFFAFLAAVQLFFVYYAFRNKKYLLPYIGLFIMLGPFFLNWMNGIRQCLAMCIFVFLVEFIEKRKLIPYTIGILVAFSLHKSAIMLFPLYFILWKPFKWGQNRTITFILLFLAITIGLTPTWLSLINKLEGFLSFMGYDYYSENIQRITEEANRSVSWGPSRLGDLFITLFILWYYPKMKQYYAHDKQLPYYFILFFFGACSYNLFINTSHIFLRPAMYFTIFKLPLTAYLLVYLKKKHFKLSYSLLAVIAYTYIYFEIYKASLIPNWFEDFTTYKFFFNYIA